VRTICMTVVMTDDRGKERWGDIILEAYPAGLEIRKQWHELFAAACVAMDGWRGTNGWRECDLAIYIEQTEVDDRLGGFIRLQTNTANAAKLPIYKQIVWKEEQKGDPT